MTIRKSLWMSRYRFMVMVCLAGLLSWIFLGYFSMMEGNIENLAYHNNLEVMTRMFYVQQVFAKQQKEPCQALDKPDLFSQTIGQFGITLATKEIVPAAKKWDYNAKTHQLVYYVGTKRYFRSPQGQKITITLYCRQGDISYKESPHAWCKKINFWRCGQWDG